MTEAELRDIVRAAILEVMGPSPRRALVVFTGGLLGFEDAIASLRVLAAQGVQLDYLQTPSAERILDQDLIRSLGMREVSKRMVEEHDMLIAPTLTSNIAAKVAHGIADCLASNLFSEFIMANRLVVASRTAICPDGSAKQSWFPHMPPAYAGVLAGLDGPAAPATASPAAATPAPAPGVVPCARSLISQQVVQQLPNGVELRVTAGARVTALARDLAAARSIRITREV